MKHTNMSLSFMNSQSPKGTDFKFTFVSYISKYHNFKFKLNYQHSINIFAYSLEYLKIILNNTKLILAIREIHTIVFYFDSEIIQISYLIVRFVLHN